MSLLRDSISIVFLVLGFVWVARNFWTIINNSEKTRFVSPVGCLASILFVVGAAVAKTLELIVAGVIGMLVDNLVMFTCRRSIERQREQGYVPSPSFAEVLRRHLIGLTLDHNSMALPDNEVLIWDHPEFKRTETLNTAFHQAFHWIDGFFDSLAHELEDYQGLSIAEAKENYPVKCIEALMAVGVSHEDSMKDFQNFQLAEPESGKA